MPVIFITGTDTNAGKTAVSSLLTAFLRGEGSTTTFRALKPFCSGDRTDALLLWELQDRSVPLEEINPFYFSEPLSPWTAARLNGDSIPLDRVMAYLHEQALRADLLLVEGAGGLLAPLGERFCAADLIGVLEARPLVVAANRLGVLNHTLLTLEALERRNVRNASLVLADTSAPDSSAQSNESDLRLLLPETPIFRLPFLPQYRPEAEFIRAAAAVHIPVLQAIFQSLASP